MIIFIFKSHFYFRKHLLYKQDLICRSSLCTLGADNINTQLCYFNSYYKFADSGMKIIFLVSILLLLNSCETNIWQPWTQDSSQRMAAFMIRTLSKDDYDIQSAFDSILQTQKNRKRKKVEASAEKKRKIHDRLIILLRTV